MRWGGILTGAHLVLAERGCRIVQSRHDDNESFLQGYDVIFVHSLASSLEELTLHFVREYLVILE